MAWLSSGTSNSALIQALFNNALIRTPAVKEAFLRVDRAHYCPAQGQAYQDSPQPIVWKATISAPHMHASAVEELLPLLLPFDGKKADANDHDGGDIMKDGNEKRSRRVLDVGSGSGYLTHIFAEMVCTDGTAGGEVVGIEHIEALRALGETNMRKSKNGRGFLDSGRVKFVNGDGRRGWDDGKGGWDVIHVGAAARVLHPELIEQLRKPGRMFIPVEDVEGKGNQSIWVVDKDVSGEVRKRKLYGVRYVPLTDAEE